MVSRRTGRRRIVIVGLKPELAPAHAYGTGGWMERVFFGLGAITPLGGLAFIVGWFALARASWTTP